MNYESISPTHAIYAESIVGYLRRMAALPAGSVDPVSGYRAGDRMTLYTVVRAHPSCTSDLPFIVAAGHLRDYGVLVTPEGDERIEPSTPIWLASEPAR